jgi:putative ABC transport system permease protein
MRSLRLKFAFRALLKNKMYTILNVAGLAIGLAVSIAIYLYLKSELTYDQHFNKHEEVFRVQSSFTLNNRTEMLAGAGFAMAPMLKKEYEYVENATRLMHIEQKIRFTANTKEFFVGNVALADANFFDVLGLEFLSGDADTALKQPQSLVLTQSLAHDFFGEEDPVGKKISTANYTYTVTGLIKDLPANTHHKFSALISSFYNVPDEKAYLSSLWDPGILTFVRLESAAYGRQLLGDFELFYDKYMSALGNSLGGSYKISLTPLDEIHYNGGYQFDRPVGKTAYLYAFAGIGLLILVLACINYINMATARSLKRIKEMGMRKLLGASSFDIRALVLVESVLLSVFALVLAFVILELCLSFTPLNNIIEKDFSLDFAQHPNLLWFPLLLAFLVGLISGLYPATILSRVPGLLAAKGAYAGKKSGILLRKVLVGFQFTISVAVVITALLMYRQIQFVNQKDLGFNKDNIILIPLQDSLTMAKIPELKLALKESPYVMASATASSIIGKGTGRALLAVERRDGPSEKRIMDFMRVSTDYFETMEIDFIEGRPFGKEDFEGDEDYVIVNQRMAKSMFKDSPIGQKLSWEYNEDGEPLAEATVIGVVADFNAHSLHAPIEPLVIGMEKKNSGTLHVRVKGSSFESAIAEVEQIWGADNSNRPFHFTFLDEDLAKQYKEEEKQSRLILFLTYLAIFISFLGLTGLASFSTALRTKEIGIRKVLGAEVFQMIQLIFKDMLRLITISVSLALPLAYLLTQYWLKNFAFTASLSPLIFIFSAGLAVLVSYVIVSYHSFKVAKRKVVQTLKYE